MLGAQGSGKTTMLWDLANTLLDRAEQDETVPIACVLNLTSWAVNRLPLKQWLVEELSLNYDVPPKACQAFVEAGAILPLLDGLDEVAPSGHAACVEAINAYLQDDVWLVVSCQEDRYFSLRVPLQVQAAVKLQPLTHPQIVDYLRQAGSDLDAVREALDEDDELFELATSPLMLDVITRAYAGVQKADLLATAKGDRQSRIFHAYVERMFKRRSATRYSQKQSTRWLSWLAKEMIDRKLPEFYLETLQPTWLPTHESRRLYRSLLVLGVAFVGGLVGTLAAGLSMLAPGFGGLGFGLVFAVVGGLVYVLGFGMDIKSRPGTHLAWFWDKLRNGLGVLIVVGLLLGVLPSLDLKLVVGLVGGLVFGLSYRLDSEIRPTEILTWSWDKLLGGLLVILIGGILVGLLVVPTFGLIAGGLVCLLFWILAGLSFGWSGELLAEPARSRPNQVVRNSAKNGGIVGLLGGLIAFMTVGLVFALPLGPIRGALFGLDVGIVFGLGVCLVRGGGAALQHWVLRFGLWRSGCVPFRYVHFLEEAVDRILMRRESGGYRFIHGSLMRYFASL
jgi:hypothetical protein